jgi:adenine-specific DNA-methyltransferase
MPLLHWLTRDQDIHAATHTPYRLLEQVAAHSHGDPDAGNMVIQGDNLAALKALLPYYAGKVKCIFIDPPYNTRSAFEHYDDNLEHTQWLALMYPRLELLRQLLSEDGSIWVHLDDNEMHYNKVLMDEVFGRANFIANVCWQKSYAVRSNAEFFSTSVEHIAVYAKSRGSLRIGKFPRSAEQTARFDNPDNDKRGVWQSITMTISLMSGARGRQFAKTGVSANVYEVRSPTGKVFLPTARRCWSRNPAEFERLDRDGRIWWGRDGNSPPRMKMFLSETEDGVMPTTLWASGEQFGFNQDGVREIRALGMEFPTPKPERLIYQVLGLCTQPDDLVLDSFLGSGTTAAVAHKMGRRYIGIEMGDQAMTHCVPRLQKVIEGEQGGISEAVAWQGGGGFRFYELGVPVFDENGHVSPSIRFAPLAAHLWFVSTGIPYKGRAASPFLGAHEGIGYFLLYNGILGDKSVSGGNVLTARILASLPKHEGAKVIFGEGCRLSAERLQAEGITFRQIPYEIKAR